MPTITVQVNATNDDGYVSSGVYYYNSSYSYGRIGKTGSTPYHWYTCFRGINIPKGDIIDSAKLQLDGATTESAATCIGRIQANAVDNPTPPTDITGFNALALTTAYTDWTIGAVVDGTWIDSADFAAVIQEIVDRAGWASGNAIAITMHDQGSSTDARRAFYSYDHAGNITGAKLIITHHTPSGTKQGGSTAPVVVSTTGAGSKIGRGGAASGIVVAVSGGGARVGAPTGGSIATVKVVAVGGGYKVGAAATGFDAAVRQPLAKARMAKNNPIFDNSIVATSLMGGDYYGTVYQAYNGIYGRPGRLQVVGEVSIGDNSIPHDPGIQMGWISTVKSNASGTWSHSNDPYLEITFSPRTVRRLRIFGDKFRGAYPVYFGWTIFDASNTELDGNYVDANTEVEFELLFNPPLVGAVKAELRVFSWSLPNDYPCIVQFSVDDYRDLPQAELKSLAMLRERRLEGQGVPYGTMAAWELQMAFLKDPAMPRSAYRANVPITVQLGTRTGGVESYVDAGTFYADKWALADESIATVIAHDWRYLLSTDYVSLLDLNNTKSIRHLVNTILSGSKVPAPLWTTSGLDYVPPIVAIPLMTRAEAVCLCLAADNGVSVMGADGICAFKDDAFPAVSKVLNGSTHIMKGLANTSDSAPLATVIQVSFYSFTKDAADTLIFDSDQDIDVAAGEEITFRAFYTGSAAAADLWAPDFTVAPSAMAGYMTVMSQKVYAGYIEYVLKNYNPSDPLKIKHIAVLAKAVKAIKNTYEVADADAVNKYGRIVFTIDNMLIQSRAQAAAIAAAILPRYSDPAAMWNWRTPGDPRVLPGAVVNIPDLDGGDIDVQIERQQIGFGDSGPGLKEEILARA